MLYGCPATPCHRPPRCSATVRSWRSSPSSVSSASRTRSSPTGCSRCSRRCSASGTSPRRASASRSGRRTASCSTAAGRSAATARATAPRVRWFIVQGCGLLLDLGAHRHLRRRRATEQARGAGVRDGDRRGDHLLHQPALDVPSAPAARRRPTPPVGRGRRRRARPDARRAQRRTTSSERPNGMRPPRAMSSALGLQREAQDPVQPRRGALEVGRALARAAGG